MGETETKSEALAVEDDVLRIHDATSADAAGASTVRAAAAPSGSGGLFQLTPGSNGGGCELCMLLVQSLNVNHRVHHTSVPMATTASRCNPPALPVYGQPRNQGMRGDARARERLEGVDW